jgi:hypothetical protein
MSAISGGLGPAPLQHQNGGQTYCFQVHSFLMSPPKISRPRTFASYFQSDPLNRLATRVSVMEVEGREHYRGSRCMHQSIRNITGVWHMVRAKVEVDNTAQG